MMSWGKCPLAFGECFKEMACVWRVFYWSRLWKKVFSQGWLIFREFGCRWKQKPQYPDRSNSASRVKQQRIQFVKTSNYADIWKYYTWSSVSERGIELGPYTPISVGNGHWTGPFREDHDLERSVWRIRELLFKIFETENRIDNNSLSFKTISNLNPLSQLIFSNRRLWNSTTRFFSGIDWIIISMHCPISKPRLWLHDQWCIAEGKVPNSLPWL